MSSIVTPRDALVSLVRSSKLSRVPGWSASLGIVADGTPWTLCRPVDGELACEPWPPGEEADTVIELFDHGLEDWFVRGVDFSHLIKAGTMRVICGSYFDLLLFSKVLGLRPDRWKD